MTKPSDETHQNVQEYYGEVLETTSDLKTSACCTSSAPPADLGEILSLIHDEVLDKYYGCGLIIPELLKGLRVLDLGCGAGRDVFVLSKLVGEKGAVVGVDMTDAQLEVAQKHIDYHTKAFGFAQSNVTFKKGLIEELHLLGLEDNSFDVVVSNCVINLCPDKEAVLREVFRVLKPGGELYFSDVYSDRRIAEELVKNPVLFGECLSGALYHQDFLRLARKVGFLDPRVVESNTITLQNQEVEELIGHIAFDSVTYRLFKIPTLEDSCEDYGQAVRYKGTLPKQKHYWGLDQGQIFETGRITPVCRNTFETLRGSRFRCHFEYFGDGQTHFGAFPCDEGEAGAGPSQGCGDGDCESGSCGC